MTTAAAPYTREHFERLEEERLALFASKSARAERPRGRSPPRPGDARTHYARDRDRIIHSRAFRRLKHKTQVFIPYEGDHFRTRLTHTIEVAQIARSAARALGLNEDLTEAVAIGHDLGHTPFGHSGEYVLDRLLRESHPDAGGFKHNFQSVRVVDRLEKRYDEPGLNLTHDVREGLLKHTAWPRDFPFPLDFIGRAAVRVGRKPRGPARQLVGRDRAADPRPRGRPAADRGDGDRGDSRSRARSVPRAGYGSDPASRRASLIRGHDRRPLGRSRRGLAGAHRALDGEGERRRRPRSSTCGATAFPAISSVSPMPGRRLYAELREFVYRHIIHSFPVSRHDGHARRVLAGDLRRVWREPAPPSGRRAARAWRAGSRRPRILRELPLTQVEREVAERYRTRPGFYRAIADHIAGMTDSYCNTEYRQLVLE